MKITGTRNIMMIDRKIAADMILSSLLRFFLLICRLNRFAQLMRKHQKLRELFWFAHKPDSF
jgi:hypothetical protein